MKQARGDVRQVIIGVYQTLERCGAQDIVMRTRKAVRAMGYQFRDTECSEWLKPFQQVRERKRNGKGTGLERGSEHDRNGSGTDRERIGNSRAVKVSLVTKYSESNDSVAGDSVEPPSKASKRKRKERDETQLPFDAAPETVEPKERPAADDPAQPLWVRQMRAWVAAMLPRPLSTLSAEERFKLARYHAWRWCNCTGSDAKNRQAAQRIGAGLMGVAMDRRFGPLTVDDYLGSGDDAWTAGGRKPMYSAWSAIGQVEVLS